MDAEHTSALLLGSLKAAYASTLAAVGTSATQASPSADPHCEDRLTALGRQMAAAASPAEIDDARAQVGEALAQWADSVQDDLRRKTADVKELLVTLAHTAASVAASDAEHVMRFDALTVRLRRIATLDDVKTLREAVLESATQLCASVEAMSTSTRTVVSAMQAELSAYQQKLEAAEQMASRDPLTGLYNRRKIEQLLERKVAAGAPFAVGLIDLDGFKATNDRLGHRAGDDLLRQFSADLTSNVRPGDVVGRWGGDEFIIVAASAGAEAREQFARIQHWVGGRYTIEGPQGKTKVDIELSIGMAEWRPDVPLASLVDEADRAMYAAKRRARQQH